MRRFFFVYLFSICTYSSHAQKKIFDYSDVMNWPILDHQTLNSNGKYVSYLVKNEINNNKLIIQSTENDWKVEIPTHLSWGAEYVKDVDWVSFTKSDDTTCLIKLGTNTIKYFTNLDSYRIFKQKNNTFFIYRTIAETQNLVLRNLTTDKETIFKNVKKYTISSNGKTLILQVSDTTSELAKLEWINIESGISLYIDHISSEGNICLDSSGSQLAYIKQLLVDGKMKNQLKYFKKGMDSCEILIDGYTLSMDGMEVAEGESFFNLNGNKLFFYIKKNNESNVTTQKKNVHLTTYCDDSVAMVKGKNLLLTVINLDDSKKSIVQLIKPNDAGYTSDKKDISDYIVTYSDCTKNINEHNWNPLSIPNIYLVSTKDGSRRLIKERLLTIELSFSNTAKYVIWFDKKLKNWFSYNIANNTTKDITKNIHTALNKWSDTPDLPSSAGLLGWTDGDSALLIQDRFDIWKIDPDGIRSPQNITQNFGYKKNIRLRYIHFPQEENRIFHRNDTLYLSAFDLKTKNNGFFKLEIKNGNFKLISQPIRKELYYFNEYRPSMSGLDGYISPVKADDSTLFLVTKMSNKEYPNLYLTNNFEQFKPLTNFAPQDQYNWYTTELIHWTQADGTLAYGMLYKPENFDPQKKYPLILYYYEESSMVLNAYLQPALTNGLLNIPWFVTHGYLVFVPDIHFKVGTPGESAYNIVVSAAKHFMRQPWIDPGKLAIQGHSFGGFETNYIVTKTHIFAAAASCAGVVNLTSMYNRAAGGGSVPQIYFELGQGRMGATPWSRPDLYEKNSPITNVNRVTTPLLVMYNPMDFIVPYTEGQEWFSSLNRLKKKVWMLSYDNEGHVLDNTENKLDYTIRLMQFFDYYLKDKPMPDWMSGNK
jgi:dipeptidyl aminopeptidase/acylaminoacyl peptidase